MEGHFLLKIDFSVIKLADNRMRIAQGMACGFLFIHSLIHGNLTSSTFTQWVASIVKEEWTDEAFHVELIRNASTIRD